MSMGRFISLVEKMIGMGRFQISGDAEVHQSKSEVEAALAERSLKMMASFNDAAHYPNAPVWATKAYSVRTSEDRRPTDIVVFAE